MIIGAVVIVGVTVVVIAASSTACAAAATAAASSKTSKKHKKKFKNHIPPAPAKQKKQSRVNLALNQPSPLANAIEDHIFEFKEKFLDKSNIVYKQNDFSFKAKAKDMGSGLAHEVFDGISEIGSIAPQLFEEIKDIKARILPENEPPAEIDFNSSPMENYKKSITSGHKIIDKVFSTNLAKQYNPDEKRLESHLKKDITVGVLPPPGNLPR